MGVCVLSAKAQFQEGKHYIQVSGTATEGEDYGNVNPVAGTVIFSATIAFGAGETMQTVSLDFFGDDLDESQIFDIESHRQGLPHNQETNYQMQMNFCCE